MCGICGFIGAGDKDVLVRMTDSLTHRGPDEAGFFFKNGIAVGHRRLKIIDLVAGQQPMFSPDKSLVLTFNGEIYNYAELKSILERKGYKFTTACDTEVLLNAYLEWGERCVEKFNGMFAFAVIDVNKSEAFISRDRFGKKPVYYYWHNNLFVFASYSLTTSFL